MNHQIPVFGESLKRITLKKKVYTTASLYLNGTKQYFATGDLHGRNVVILRSHLGPNVGALVVLLLFEPLPMTPD